MKLLVTGGLFLAMLIGLAGSASAQAIPNVRGLVPFTAQTRYMSLPGYLRWQYFTETARWISWSESIALVQQQTVVASAPSG